MLASLWISKTGLSAQDTALATISNNLANVSTTGFKRDRAVFQDLLYQVERQPGAQSSQSDELPSGLQIGTGVRTVATQKIHTKGNFQVTEQPLDLAVNGRGFFQVLTPDGTIAYTRDGQFQTNSDGQIVTSIGLPLEPAITIPADTIQLTIGSDGVVSATVAGQTAPTQIGDLQLADFINPAGLQAIGGNLFRETQASGTPTIGTAGLDGLGTLEQGVLEGSNVSVVEELVNLITTQRAYEMNTKVIAASDQMLQFVGQTL
ncbi:MAG: flagellar basal-body rod protein FlgG [Pseudomonadales bacterium]|nr:flagellar basal-body rod protein FlgG [Pseudomonadales bacterium]MCP5214314.1 flagellar basal-body rod protein FlgG [Pseudomonadales bacterium]